MSGEILPKLLFLLLFSLICHSLAETPPKVWISEVYTGNNSLDDFIEIYDGGQGNVSLTNFSLHISNGNTSKHIPLDGLKTNSEGFLVLSSNKTMNENLKEVRNVTFNISLSYHINNASMILQNFTKRYFQSNVIICYEEVYPIPLASSFPTRGRVNRCPLSPVHIEQVAILEGATLSVTLESSGLRKWKLKSLVISIYTNETLFNTTSLDEFTTNENETHSVKIPFNATTKGQTITVLLKLPFNTSESTVIDGVAFGNANKSQRKSMPKMLTYPELYPSREQTIQYIYLDSKTTNMVQFCHCKMFSKFFAASTLANCSFLCFQQTLLPPMHVTAVNSPVSIKSTTPSSYSLSSLSSSSPSSTAALLINSSSVSVVTTTPDNTTTTPDNTTTTPDNTTTTPDNTTTTPDDTTTTPDDTTTTPDDTNTTPDDTTTTPDNTNTTPDNTTTISETKTTSNNGSTTVYVATTTTSTSTSISSTTTNTNPTTVPMVTTTPAGNNKSSPITMTTMISGISTDIPHTTASSTQVVSYSSSSSAPTPTPTTTPASNNTLRINEILVGQTTESKNWIELKDTTLTATGHYRLDWSHPYDDNIPSTQILFNTSAVNSNGLMFIDWTTPAYQQFLKSLIQMVGVLRLYGSDGDSHLLDCFVYKMYDAPLDEISLGYLRKKCSLHKPVTITHREMSTGWSVNLCENKELKISSSSFNATNKCPDMSRFVPISMVVLKADKTYKFKTQFTYELVDRISNKTCCMMSKDFVKDISTNFTNNMLVVSLSLVSYNETHLATLFKGYESLFTSNFADFKVGKKHVVVYRESTFVANTETSKKKDSNVNVTLAVLLSLLTLFVIIVTIVCLYMKYKRQNLSHLFGKLYFRSDQDDLLVNMDDVNIQESHFNNPYYTNQSV